MTLKELATEAIVVQDAVNMTGLAYRFARVVDELKAALRENGQPNDTGHVNRHPVVRLWVSKMHELAGMGFSDDARYGEAYHECQRLA